MYIFLLSSYQRPLKDVPQSTSPVHFVQRFGPVHFVNNYVICATLRLYISVWFIIDVFYIAVPTNGSQPFFYAAVHFTEVQ